MPYSQQNVNELPVAVQRLPAEARDLWVETFNGVEAETEGDGDRAYAVAWARIREHWQVNETGEWRRKRDDDAADARDPLPDVVHLAVRLDPDQVALGTGETARSVVEFIRTGLFFDMFGRPLEVIASGDKTAEYQVRLDQLVAHFDAGDAGQNVPIDFDHRYAEAGGWVKSLFREGSKGKAEVEWNALGIERVAGQVYRYLSASLNVATETLSAISLVNFPAVKGLKPVSLSAPKPGAAGEAELLDYVYCGAAPLVETWIQAPARPVPPAEGEATMTIEELLALEMPLDDLTEELKAQLATKFGLSVTAGEHTHATEPAAPDASELADAVLAQVTQSLAAGLGDLSKLGETVRALVNESVTVELRAQEAKREAAAFALRMTSEGRYALRSEPAELQALLLEIAEPQRAKVMTLLSGIHEGGLVDLGEIGTGQAGKAKGGKKVFSPEMTAIIRGLAEESGLEQALVDLFKANPELGRAEEYDLKASGL